MARKLSVHAADHSTFPANLSEAGIRDENATTYDYSLTDEGRGYCATGTVGTVSYHVRHNNTVPQEGGCPGHAQGGREAVVNLLFNPGAEGTTGWSTNNSVVITRAWDSTVARTGDQSVVQQTAPDNYGNILSLYAIGGQGGSNGTSPNWVWNGAAHNSTSAGPVL